MSESDVSERKNGLSQLAEKVTHVNKKQLFLLFLIFALAFGTRGHLMKYEYLFGFDSYYHARMTGVLLEEGSIPETDTMAYYFVEEGVTPPRNTFFWYFSAAIYKIVTLGGAYDKDLWIQFVKVLPALFGALTSVAMFFLGKEIYGRKAGYVMALMAAVVPSYVYRTLAGFFEEDCLGFLWLVIGMVFFARAVKVPVFNRKGIINAVLAGAFFGVMALTWEMFLLVPLVLSLYFVFALMHIYTKQGLGKTIDFVKLFAISFGIFGVVATINYGDSWFVRAVGYATQSVSKAVVSLGLPETAGVPLISIGFLLFAGLVMFLAYSNRQEEKKESGNKTINIIVMALLFTAVIAIIVTFMTIPELFKETSVLGQTVGEENTGKQFFGIKYNALIIFPGLALLLIPLRMFREKKEHLSSMIFFWILITYFMAWYKLKFTYTFGLPIAAAAGLIAAEIFFYLRGRTGIEKKAVALGLGFMLLVGIASATIFVPDKVPHIENAYPDWKGTLEWMENPENIPADATFFNWWDEGHWISFIGDRAVAADNRNANSEINGDFAMFMTTNDLNKAVRIAKEYDFDYLIIDSGLFSTIQSLAYYAYNTTDNAHPEIIKFWRGPRTAMLCSPVEGGFACGTNRLDTGKMALVPTKWTTTSNQVDEETSVPLYIYKAEDNSELYITNPAVNESMLGMLWFHNDEAMKYFEEVHAGWGLRIFKTRKEAIASVTIIE